MINLEVTKVVTAIQQLANSSSAIVGVDVESRRALLANTIGGTIGAKLPLPATPVDNIQQHYIDVVLPVVSDYVSQINESFIIDIDAALLAARIVWLKRYKLVHDTGCAANILASVKDGLEANGAYSELETITQVTTLLSLDEAKSADMLVNILAKCVCEHNGEA